jgi:hypothetical protein
MAMLMHLVQEAYSLEGSGSLPNNGGPIFLSPQGPAPCFKTGSVFLTV